MKITIEREKPSQIITIVKAIYLNDYAIRIFFSDGKNRVVDFKSFLSKTFHPDIAKYLNEKKFKSFKIVEGNINWNDYEMIFPIDDLYNGQIS
jgi:hypothetical protein